jgi:lysophospholipase L1-like esterase
MNADWLWRRSLGGLMLAGVVVSAQGQLVLTNYSTNTPMKIMPMGDSITDDCEVNGAWRQYLQPLLQSNGIPFKFVGRNSSSGTATFTQTNHEGYCGAVIASPGEYAAHIYTAAENYLENVVFGALINTNNKPDLMLIVIGVNDIGYGRDPYYTATNSMSNLLNLIFRYDPSPCVMISKVTSLQGATLNGYGTNASNIPVFDANLAALVNQRQALGQKVYLSDMYSAVSSNMFMSDHVHPNTNGLAAMAQEWMSRIQAIVIRTNQVTTNVIHAGDWWSYFDQGQDLGTNWSQPGYNDSAWSNGVGRLGYGEATDATVVSYGPDTNNMYPTTYFRHWFAVPGNVGFTNLNVRVSCSDGAVVYLNGSEIYRTNLPGGPIACTDLALSAVTGFSTPIYLQTNLTIGGLMTGTNLLAVEIHKSAVTNAVLGFDLELFATGYFLPPPTLSAMSAPPNMVLSWPLSNSVNYSLYSTTNLGAGASWEPDPVAVQTNGGQCIVTISPTNSMMFFQLLHP